MARRFAAGAAVGTALIVSLTACNIGGGTSNASGDQKNTKLTAAQAIALTSQKAGAVSSFKATMAEKGSFSGQATSIRATVKAQLRPQLLMSVDIPNMQLGGKSASVQEITTADAIYMKVPGLAQSSDKPWIKLSLSALKQQTGVDVQGLMSQGQGVDPAANVKMLTASKDARVVGTETVDGVRTTHYRGTYSLSDGLARLDADQRQKMQQLLNQQGLTKLNFDLWVDGQNLPRKVAMYTPAGSTTDLSITENISDYNKPVTVTAPPASEVTTETPKIPMPAVTS
jgi:LppX_LprAFG lipoprotein